MPPKKALPIHPVALTIAVLMCCFTGCVIVAVLSSAVGQSAHATAAQDAESPDGTIAVEKAVDPKAQAPLTQEEYRQILIEAGLDPHLADSPAERKAAASAQTARKGKIKHPTHLFDSKESAQRAAVATGRGGAAGYLREAASHGLPIEAGATVIIIDRGFEYARVRSPDLGIEGWTMISLIDER